MEELAQSFGPAALALLASIYAVVILFMVSCELGRCLGGKTAFGAEDDKAQVFESPSVCMTTDGVHNDD